MKTKKKINIGFVLWNILFILFIFVNVINNISDNFALVHFDELISIICYIYIAFNYKKIPNSKIKMILWFSIFILIGLCSTLIFRIQDIYPSLVDGFIIIPRFFLVYISLLIISNSNNSFISNYFYIVSKIITIILFALVLHDLVFTPFFSKNGFRYFTESMSLMFSHPTYLATASVTLLIYIGYQKKMKNKLIYMIMISIVCFLSLRGKAIGFILFYWLCYLMLFKLKIDKKYYKIIFLIGIAGVIFVVKDNIIEYFFSPNRYSPRNILLNDSFSLMFKHFPFGTGFATFGSALARQYYSGLYVDLGYLANYGMSSINGAFLLDSFWPTIFAQFGIFGTIIFIYVVYLFIKNSLNVMKENICAGFSMLMVMAYVLICSIAEASFFNPACILLFVLYALFETEYKKNKRIDSDEYSKR